MDDFRDADFGDSHEVFRHLSGILGVPIDPVDAVGVLDEMKRVLDWRRLRDWFASPLREAANTAFTAGELRDAATAFESAFYRPGDKCGLSDAECDAFRRLPVSFNDMVREIYAAGLRRGRAAQS